MTIDGTLTCAATEVLHLKCGRCRSLFAFELYTNWHPPSYLPRLCVFCRAKRLARWG